MVATAAPANASDIYLCGPGSSYSTCTSAGYTDHGYSASNTVSYWYEDVGNGHNCTNYAAYVEIKNGFSSQDGYNPGNASSWGGYFSNLGFTVNNTPAVGAVAWWNSNYDGAPSDGHVAYVESYTSTTITVPEDQWPNSYYPNGAFDWRTITEGSSTWPSGFIHLKDLATSGNPGGTSSPTFTGRPYAIEYDPGGYQEMDVFARGTDGHVYKDTWNTSSWGGFSVLS